MGPFSADRTGSHRRVAVPSECCSHLIRSGHIEQIDIIVNGNAEVHRDFSFKCFATASAPAPPLIASPFEEVAGSSAGAVASPAVRPKATASRPPWPQGGRARSTAAEASAPSKTRRTRPRESTRNGMRRYPPRGRRRAFEGGHGHG